MEVCSGGIIGMGEEIDDVIELCYALRKWVPLPSR